jgi:hypothetical protein
LIAGKHTLENRKPNNRDICGNVLNRRYGSRHFADSGKKQKILAALKKANASADL